MHMKLRFLASSSPKTLQVEFDACHIVKKEHSANLLPNSGPNAQPS